MILDKIIASTKIRVAKAKGNLSPSGLLKALDKAELKAPNFKNGLMSIDDVSIIAEIKKASPSKGLIRGDFDHMKIAEDMTNAIFKQCRYLPSLNILKAI